MFEFRTAGFSGYAVKYSPYSDSRIAVGAAQNFGLVGNGRLYILNLTHQGIVAEKWYMAASDPHIPKGSHRTNTVSVVMTLKMPSTTSRGPN